MLIIGEGIADVNTAGVFADIAATLRSALTKLAIPHVLLFCKDLRKCQIQTSRQYLILAPQNLARYFDFQDRLAVLSSGWPPPSSILYNFEHISRTQAYGPEAWQTVNAHVLQIYKHFDVVWDFDANNVQSLQRFGVSALHVPFAFSEGVYGYGGVAQLHNATMTTPPPPKARCTEAHGDVDVLFYGRVNDYRRRVISHLQQAGLRVLYPNVNGDSVFGEHLHCLTRQAKIVLNLRYFNEDAEWKLSRILPLLANRRFVISESSGSPSEIERFQGGVVFVTPGDHVALARACAYYLQHPHIRRVVAKKGFAIAASVRMEDVLRPVFMERSCRAGCCLPQADI